MKIANVQKSAKLQHGLSSVETKAKQRAALITDPILPVTPASL